MLAGVNFCVSTPSTPIAAPEGNELILSDQF
jgi:hypothetical protein